VGRFLSVDPIMPYLNRGTSFGRFTYAANNPFHFVDPDGRQEKAVDSTCTGSRTGCPSQTDGAPQNDIAFRAAIDARVGRYLRVGINQNGELRAALNATNSYSVSIGSNGKGTIAVGDSKFGFDAGPEDFGDLERYDKRIPGTDRLEIGVSFSREGMSIRATFSRTFLRFANIGFSFEFKMNPFEAIQTNSGMLGNAARVLDPSSRWEQIERCINEDC
jgi:hypothetical protein